MGIINNLSGLLDIPVWEKVTDAPVAAVAGSFVMGETDYDNNEVMFVQSASEIYIYNHDQDGWIKMPSSGIAGTFGAGSCGVWHPEGPSDFATGGSTTTINTNLTINRSLKGYKVWIMYGPAKMEEKTIISNTYGPNSILRVDSPFSTSITSGSLYQLYTGRYWFFNAGAGSVGFAYYDTALNAWTQRSVTGIPTTWGTSARLCHTGNRKIFASGTATSGTTSTLINSAKNWAPDQWKGYVIQIVDGTNKGYQRTISGNTNTSITVSPNYSIAPDNTSQYIIQGAATKLYLLGNNSSTMYIYDIPSNTWSTITPSVERSGAPGAGITADWIYDVEDAEWTDETKLLNGRYIYSFRGGSDSTLSHTLDVYDVSNNAWSVKPYGISKWSIFQNSQSFYYKGSLFVITSSGYYLVIQSFVLSENCFKHCLTVPFDWRENNPIGNRVWIKPYINGSDKLLYIYYNSKPRSTLDSPEFHRLIYNFY